MRTKSICKTLKRSLILLLVLISSIFFAFPSPVYAASLEVTFESDPLFPSTIIWYPGLSVTKSVTVKNNGDKTEKIAVEAFNESETGGLASVIEFKVSEGGVEVYNSAKTLRNFFDEGVIQLSELGAGETTTYDLTATLKATAGNEYQGKKAKFDFRIGSWEEVVGGEGVVSPEVTIGPVTAPVCTAAVPPAPTLISAIPVGEDGVALTWTPVSPVTHYLIAYGLVSKNYIYGNPNVGNVTSFTVWGLSPGITYYFAVKGVNDCMPGPFSNELSARIVLVPGLPPGFVPIGEIGVRGEATAAAIPEVAGITTPSAELIGKPVCFWWWVILILEGVILVFYYWSIRKEKGRTWFIFPIALGIVAFLAHEFAHRFYIPSRFCPWFWLGDLLAVVVTTLLYFSRLRET